MRRRAAVVAALAGVLALPLGSAAAAAPPARAPGPYHGGGLPESGPVLAYLLVGQDGRDFEAAITLRAACDAYGVPVQARIAVPEGRLEADGTATVEREFTGTAAGPDGRPAREEGASTVTVSVGRRGAASGTVRLASTFFDSETGEEVARCDSGEVAFQAQIVPRSVGRRGARSRLPRSEGTFLGVAGVQPLVARVAEGGQIDGMAFVYRSGCQLRPDGRGTRRIIFLPEFRVRRDGSFRVRASQQLLVPDGREEVRVELRGRYVPGGALRATVRLRGALFSPDVDVDSDDGETRPAKRCDTGKLPVRALPALGEE